jgi:hypothetical protein
MGEAYPKEPEETARKGKKKKKVKYYGKKAQVNQRDKETEREPGEQCFLKISG